MNVGEQCEDWPVQKVRTIKLSKVQLSSQKYNYVQKSTIKLSKVQLSSQKYNYALKSTIMLKKYHYALKSTIKLQNTER